MAEHKNIVIVLVKNSQGQLFVNRRALSRELYPGYYGLGSGGRMEPGETDEEGAKRELFEEVGLETPVDYLFEYERDIENVEGEVMHVCQYIYETKFDGDLPLCDEWQWCGWMTDQEVDELLAEEKLAPDTAETYRRYKEYLAKKAASN